MKWTGPFYTGTPQHGLSSGTMALITSDWGKMCSPSIKWS